MRAFRLSVLFGVFALLGMPIPVLAQDKASTFVFTGVDVGQNSEAYWLGAIHALNGDLATDGFLLRALGVYVEYDYIGGLNNTGIDGEVPLFDAMIGYQVFRSGHRFAGYVGVESQDHELTPNDPTNSVNGQETGFKVAAEATLDLRMNWFADARGSYSTAFDTYWSHFRLGYKYDRFKFGPEATFSGNQEDDAQRLGGFVEISSKLGPLPVYITLSGGHTFADEGGTASSTSEGAYGNFGFAFAF